MKDDIFELDLTECRVACPVCDSQLDITKAVREKTVGISTNALGHFFQFLQFLTMTFWHLFIAYAIGKYLEAMAVVLILWFITQCFVWLHYWTGFFRRFEQLEIKDDKTK